MWLHTGSLALTVTVALPFVINLLKNVAYSLKYTGLFIFKALASKDITLFHSHRDKSTGKRLTFVLLEIYRNIDQI